jgi:hypothetical protein
MSLLSSDTERCCCSQTNKTRTTTTREIDDGVLGGGESRWGRKRQSMDQNFSEKKKNHTHTHTHTHETQICCKILKMDFRDRQLHVLGKQLKESCRNGKTKRPAPTLSPRHWTALTRPTHAHAVKRITQFFCALLTHDRILYIFFLTWGLFYLWVYCQSEPASTSSWPCRLHGWCVDWKLFSFYSCPIDHWVHHLWTNY